MRKEQRKRTKQRHPWNPTTPAERRQRSEHQTNKTTPNTYLHPSISNIIAATAAIFVVIAIAIAIGIGRRTQATGNNCLEANLEVRFPLIVFHRCGRRTQATRNNCLGANLEVQFPLIVFHRCGGNAYKEKKANAFLLFEIGMPRVS